MSRTSDAEINRRIVDGVERRIRRDGLTGPDGKAEARRRFDVACPWSSAAEKGADGRYRPSDERWAAYFRDVDRAMTRLFSTASASSVVETDGPAPLAMLPELEAWAAAQRIELRRPGAGRKNAATESDGPATLDLFGGAA